MNSVREMDAFEERAQSFLADVLAKTAIPGAGIAVSLEGSRREAFAGLERLTSAVPLNAQSRFQLGCLLKLIVSLVGLELSAAGKLDLFAPIRGVLPELHGCPVGDGASLAHLLSHTSGYRGLNVFDPHVRSMDWKQLVEFLHGTAQHFTPGDIYSYEHSETVLAAEVIQRVAGSSLLELADRFFLKDLGIELRTPAQGESEGEVGQHGLDPGTGKLRCVTLAELSPDGRPFFSPLWENAFSTKTISLPEMLSLTEFISGQSDGTTPHTKVAATITRNLLQKPAVKLPSMFGPGQRELPADSFGMGICRWSNGFYGVAGGVFGQCHGIRFDPARGLAVAVGLNVLNTTLRNLIVGRVTEDLAGQAFVQDEDEGSHLAASGGGIEPDDIAGGYAGAGGSILNVQSAPDGLECTIREASREGTLRWELQRVAERRYRFKQHVPGLSIGFQREPRSRRVAVMLGQTAYRKVS